MHCTSNVITAYRNFQAMEPYNKNAIFISPIRFANTRCLSMLFYPVNPLSQNTFYYLNVLSPKWNLNLVTMLEDKSEDGNIETRPNQSCFYHTTQGNLFI